MASTLGGSFARQSVRAHNLSTAAFEVTRCFPVCFSSEQTFRFARSASSMATASGLRSGFPDHVSQAAIASEGLRCVSTLRCGSGIDTEE